MSDVPVGEGVFRVVGACAVVRTPDDSFHYLYKHALFDAETVTAESVDHLVSAGLIAPETISARVPSEQWTKQELEDYAKANQVDLDGARTKKDILAALTTSAD